MKKNSTHESSWAESNLQIGKNDNDHTSSPLRDPKLTQVGAEVDPELEDSKGINLMTRSFTRGIVWVEYFNYLRKCWEPALGRVQALILYEQGKNHGQGLTMRLQSEVKVSLSNALAQTLVDMIAILRENHIAFEETAKAVKALINRNMNTADVNVAKKNEGEDEIEECLVAASVLCAMRAQAYASTKTAPFFSTTGGSDRSIYRPRMGSRDASVGGVFSRSMSIRFREGRSSRHLSHQFSSHVSVSSAGHRAVLPFKKSTFNTKWALPSQKLVGSHLRNHNQGYYQGGGRLLSYLGNMEAGGGVRHLKSRTLDPHIRHAYSVVNYTGRSMRFLRQDSIVDRGNWSSIHLDDTNRRLGEFYPQEQISSAGSSHGLQ